jgi:hypothetical protein
MDKKLLAYICITVISIAGAMVIGVLYYNPDNFDFPDGHNFHRERNDNPYERHHKDFFSRAEHRPQNVPYAPLKKLIGGICALALLGYLLVICLQKLIRDDKTDSVVLANALHKISLKSGRTEFELFVKAAEEWSIPKAQIDQDFRNYMGANVLPYYVKDLVRKNSDDINESLEKDKQIKSSSRWDLVKALLLFPGCFLIPFFLILILRPYLSHSF